LVGKVDEDGEVFHGKKKEVYEREMGKSMNRTFRGISMD
jgi:hypothetical protein